MSHTHNECTFVYRSFAFVLVSLTLFSISMSPIQGVIWINSWNNRSLDYFFAGITHLGNGIVLVPFVLLLSYIRLHWAIALVVSATLQGSVVSILKHVVFPFAKRPITQLPPELIHLVSGVEVYRSNSFPSGHAVTIFGLCMFLALCFRNRTVTVVLLMLALAVGLSRVYLLEHFVTDVAVGAIVGTSLSIITFHYFENLDKPTWMMNKPKLKLRSSN